MKLSRISPFWIKAISYITWIATLGTIGYALGVFKTITDYFINNPADAIIKLMLMGTAAFFMYAINQLFSFLKTPDETNIDGRNRPFHSGNIGNDKGQSTLLKQKEAEFYHKMRSFRIEASRVLMNTIKNSRGKFDVDYLKAIIKNRWENMFEEEYEESEEELLLKVITESNDVLQLKDLKELHESGIITIDDGEKDELLDRLPELHRVVREEIRKNDQ